MKKLLTIFSILAAFMLTSSCQKELPDDIKNVTVNKGGQGNQSETPTPTPTPTPTSVLQLNKYELSFMAAEGNDSFTITSNTSWTIESDQTWCMVSISSGSDNTTVTVNVTENTSTSSRSATITVKAGDLSKTIAVTQVGAKVVLQLSKTSMSFNSSNGSDSFTVTSNTSWTIESDKGWCMVSSSSGSNDATVTVNVTENTSTSSRTATITVKAGDILLTIAVMQVDESARMFTVNGVSFKMIRVEGGTFTMGGTSEQGSDALNNEKPTHRVTLSTYYIGETEVTQELWKAVISSNPSYFKGDQRPVEEVSWDACLVFIRMLNSLTGTKFRLPTEAEWEFAARGGNKSRGYKYAGSNAISNVAWYWENSNSQTHEVATKSPNELGLYDMSGNVWEWCQDWYGTYSSNSQTNPTGPASGYAPVNRGGCWSSSTNNCRVSNRSGESDPYSIGLRLAL